MRIYIVNLLSLGGLLTIVGMTIMAYVQLKNYYDNDDARTTWTAIEDHRVLFPLSIVVGISGIILIVIADL